MTSRWFRGSDFEPGRERSANFDPITEGERHLLSPEVSLAIWERVCNEAIDSNGQRDEPRARQRFHQVAARIAARDGQLRRGPGKTTLVEAEAPDRDAFAELAPGRETEVEVNARRWERRMSGTEATSSAVAPPHKGEGEGDAALASLVSGPHQQHEVPDPRGQAGHA